jgi:hypothetical protein
MVGSRKGTDSPNAYVGNHGVVTGGRSWSRNDFLRLGGAGFAGLTLLGGAVCGGGSSGGGANKLT